MITIDSGIIHCHRSPEKSRQERNSQERTSQESNIQERNRQERQRNEIQNQRRTGLGQMLSNVVHS